MTTGTMTRWRIYTEYVHTRHISGIVNKYFDNYSMFSGIGHYDGEKERCLVIEIITNKERSIEIEAICRKINSDNCQKCCFVTSELVDTVFITERR